MTTQMINLAQDRERGLTLGAELIKAGQLVAFPTETVYGLGANGFDYAAVAKIFEAKGRPADNPLILHVAHREDALPLVSTFSDTAKRLAEIFWPGPLTLVLPKSGIIPNNVTANLDTVAVRCPGHDDARALIEKAGVPIAAPSANTSSRPSPTRAQHVLADLNGKIPLILDGGECTLGVESTVLALEPKPLLLRPGLVTKEALERVIGEVEVHAAVLAEASEDGGAPSPGMKHRHYAPNAEVFVVTGESCAEITRKICESYDAAHARGKCVILATEQTAPFYSGRNYVIMGNRDKPESVCTSLFSCLREAEAAGAQTIFIEALEAKGAGLAFMNRALRSAGFRFL